MTRTRTQRLLSVLTVLAMLLVGTAIPAVAAANGSARLVTPTIFAGSGGAVTVEVTNNASPGIPGVTSGKPINAVQVFPPTDIFEPDGGLILPDGWEGYWDEDLEVAYLFATSTAGIAPGAKASFTLAGTAAPQADDTSGPVFVQVSDDGGTTAASAGSPPMLTAKILEIVSTGIVKPSFATDTDAKKVTAGQSNAPVAVTITNHGTAVRSVTASVAKASGSSSASGSKAASIPAGTQATIEVPVTFGSAGDLGLSVGAGSANSTAASKSIGGITVQTAVNATYKAGSLSPRALVPGQPGNVKVSIDKTGTQALHLKDAGTRTGGATLRIGSYATTLETDVAAGAVTHNFDFPVNVPTSLSDGVYTPTLTLVGFDGNGALVDIPPLDLDTITLDRIAPVVTPIATPNAPRIQGATPAATNGWNITFSGSAYLGEVGGDKCTGCTISDAAIVALPSGTRLPANVTINNGDLGGSGSFTFPSGTTQAYLSVTVAKSTGLAGSGDSANFEVDLVKPTLTSAITGRGTGNDYVDVTFSELVGTNGMSVSDWRVDGNVVTSIEPAPAPPNPPGTPSAGHTALRLHLGQRFADRNARPAVQYSPLANRAFDRVSQTVIDTTLTAADGIAPALPTIKTVAGMERQEGAFWTNDSTPSATISGLEVDANNTVAIYRDLNGDGKLQASERTSENRLGAAGTDASEVTIDALEDLGNSDRSIPVVAVVLDAASNVSPAAAAVIELDFTVPVIVSFTANGNDVTVTFSEPIARGRNAAFDWTITAVQNGTTRSRPVDTVSGTGSTRTLAVSAAAYDPSKGPLTGVTYRFRGFDPAERYEDRATNDLVDQSKS